MSTSVIQSRQSLRVAGYLKLISNVNTVSKQSNNGLQLHTFLLLTKLISLRGGQIELILFPLFSNRNGHGRVFISTFRSQPGVTGSDDSQGGKGKYVLFDCPTYQ